MILRCTICAVLFYLFLITVGAQSQSISSPVLQCITDLEGLKDPKCHATASRLEDFMFGTALNHQARALRIEYQKERVLYIWRLYSKQLKRSTNKPVDKAALFNAILEKNATIHKNKDGYKVKWSSGLELVFSDRDYRQYSSVAYGLRAILSVEQAMLFSSETLEPLSNKQIERLKYQLDFYVLSLLKLADKYARTENSRFIIPSYLEKSKGEILAKKTLIAKQEDLKTVTQDRQKIEIWLNAVIDKKLEAYQNYNQINQSVFLRNIQVYFSKVPWPKSEEESKAVKNYFMETAILFSKGLLEEVYYLSKDAKKEIAEYPEMHEAVSSFLPHRINQFEDVIYFPKLHRKEQINIESYDLDAFRDAGLHWQYLKFAIADLEKDKLKMLDPFAMELATEAIAQFSLLLFRIAGEVVVQEDKAYLDVAALKTAMLRIQDKLTRHQEAPNQVEALAILPEKTPSGDQHFLEVTQNYGLNIEHRNSDWLNRLIRSYVLKKEENLAKLSIPPAFGGGGIACEDIDQDGWVDVLILTGKGLHLLKNIKGKSFEDITPSSGLEWKRADGTDGEARQPILADFDNDGLVDIMITYANDNHRIYKNKGKAVFEDMSSKAKLGGEGLVGGPATALDFDNDGLLDLYIGYFGNYLKGELPTLARHNTNASPNKLFKNKGGFVFEEVSEKAGIENLGWTQATGHADINGDGWQDIIVGNDFGINAYYLNQQDGTFKDESIALGLDKPSYTMNIGLGDFNRDKRPDFYISNIVVMEKDDKYVLPNKDTKAHFDAKSLATMRVVEANDFFLSKMEADAALSFELSENIGRGYSSTGWSWDADFFDFDNDGDEDLYCLTGMNQYSIYGRENEYYVDPDGNKANVRYADSKEEHNVLFENRNGFLEIVSTEKALSYKGTSRSAAYFDMDNDGDLDVIVNEYQGKARLFENQTKNKNNWIAIELQGDPNKGVNRDAIGANLTVIDHQGKEQWKEVYSTTGYLSDHPKTLYFGLGKNKEKLQLIINWPNGTKQNISNLKPNKKHVIKQD